MRPEARGDTIGSPAERCGCLLKYSKACHGAHNGSRFQTPKTFQFESTTPTSFRSPLPFPLIGSRPTFRLAFRSLCKPSTRARTPFARRPSSRVTRYNGRQSCSRECPGDYGCVISACAPLPRLLQSRLTLSSRQVRYAGPFSSCPSSGTHIAPSQSKVSRHGSCKFSMASLDIL